MPTKKLLLFLVIIGLVACNNNTGTVATTNATEQSSYLAIADSSLAAAPFYQQRMRALAAAAAQAVPVLRLKDSMTAQQLAAQDLALSNKEFLKYTKDAQSGNALRNEVMVVQPALPSDLNASTAAACKDGGCYKVELYNYPYNLTSAALVNINSQQVLAVNHLPQMQPDIPNYLRDFAIKIAVHSKLVQEALGYQPNETEALMAATKTALNKSKCERSMHLCVAPTFVKGNKALWAIVDLTDNKLVGIRWTNVGDAGPVQATERKVQNETISSCYCKTEKAVDKDNWKFNYMLTSSDGLRISSVSFNGQPIISNAKLVDWHVSYSNTDGFGYSDAVGCPTFSNAAVVAIEEPRIYALESDSGIVGFALEQKFYSEGWPRPCNYNYLQRFEFYKDGRFRFAVASLGRGCGNDGTYRPVLRIAMANTNNNFFEWNGAAWQNWATEKYQLQNERTLYTPEQYQYKIEQGRGGFYIAPGHGQFNDGGRGDFAWTYVTKNKPGIDEGETDLPTIGPCCNTDFHQGPEKFIGDQPDNIQNSSLVLWYVPQLKNDDTPGKEYCWAKAYIKNGVYTTQAFPCIAGPMLVPVAK
jgi:hypothetical protein